MQDLPKRRRWLAAMIKASQTEASTMPWHRSARRARARRPDSHLPTAA